MALSGAAAAGIVASPILVAPAKAHITGLATSGERRLKLLNLHTGERVNSVYWAEGGYIDDGLAELDRVLRDFRTGDVVEMDRELLDLIYALHRKMESNQPFEIISGYRSPKTNAKLRQNSNGVAKRSYHMKAMAIDLRLSGGDLRHLHRAAKSLEGGGVGLYTKSGFIHMDTGPVRYW
ncbi:MAG: DUF882 domain-containing protein [Rhodovibrionaceae bacterium]|nr:DUF882 domain-containing protein [Rhodovibrionaceae bacterium]